MSAAELLGAVIFVLSPSGVSRNIAASFGLGFALCIVFADIVPDATEGFLPGWGFLAAGAALGAALMFATGRLGFGMGNAGALAGMGLHNIGEGVVLAAAGPALSPLVVAAAIAHKLPEGLVVFSLADRVSMLRRWTLAFALSLLIPLGTRLSIPEDFEKPVLAFAAGVLALALIKALAVLFRLPAAAPASRRGITAATAGGAVLAGLTCLVI